MEKQDAKTETVEDPKPEGETPEGKETKPQPATETVESLKAENERLELALKERNKEEAARRKKLEAFEKAEQERIEASKSELDKANERAAKAEAEKKALELSLMRRDVASKYGLPAALVDRLKGETPEELETDAKTLLEALPKPADKDKKSGSLNPTNPAGGSQTETPAQKKARLFGTPPNIFDPAFAKSKGGGVQFPPEE